jgi:hypothetical protein
MNYQHSRVPLQLSLPVLQPSRAAKSNNVVIAASLSSFVNPEPALSGFPLFTGSSGGSH